MRNKLVNGFLLMLAVGLTLGVGWQLKQSFTWNEDIEYFETEIESFRDVQHEKLYSIEIRVDEYVKCMKIAKHIEYPLCD
jgi:outer membrane lipopolysaccharide assembly protein LptE/RlpB